MKNAEHWKERENMNTTEVRKMARHRAGTWFAFAWANLPTGVVIGLLMWEKVHEIQTGEQLVAVAFLSFFSYIATLFVAYWLGRYIRPFVVKELRKIRIAQRTERRYYAKALAETYETQRSADEVLKQFS